MKQTYRDNPQLTMRGVIAVLTTPFAADGSLDFDSFGRDLRRVVEAGAAAVLLPAEAAETECLVQEERESLAAAALALLRSYPLERRVPLIGAAESEDRDERFESVEVWNRLGCDGVLVAVPAGKPDEYEREVRELADLDPGFLMLRHRPAPLERVPLIARLFRGIPRFTCLVLDSSDRVGDACDELREATGGRLHLSVDQAALFEGFEHGAQACLSIGPHEIHIRIHEILSRGDTQAALALLERLRPFEALASREPRSAPLLVKRLLCAAGVYSTARMRRADPPPEREPMLGELVDGLAALQAELRRP